MAKRLHAVRWTIAEAAGEFPVSAKTLSERLRSAGIEHGGDGKFSTSQICDATFGDLRGEQTREARHRANKLEIQNLRTLNEVIDKTVALRFIEGVAVVLRREILASSMTDEEKDDCLANIKKLFDAGTVTNALTNE